jgi:hypothetical protein
MLYIQLKDGLPTGHPIIHSNLLQVIPPNIIQEGRLPTVDDIIGYGFTIYRNTLRPTIGEGEHFKVVEEATPVLGDDRIAYQQWVKRDMTEEERDLYLKVRVSHNQRDRRTVFKSTDWYVTRHAEEIALGIPNTLDAQKYTDVLQYRQNLRDTDLSTDPLNVVWPTPPAWMTSEE